MAHTWTLRHPEKGRKCRSCKRIIHHKYDGRRETHAWCRLAAAIRRGLEAFA
jgi:formamidopyrimidine-DNA glycosylase